MSPAPSSRTQRAAELRAARQQITARLLALDPSIAVELERDDRQVLTVTADRLAAVALRMVHQGATHAQTARALRLPTEAITPLIAPRPAR